MRARRSRTTLLLLLAATLPACGRGGAPPASGAAKAATPAGSPALQAASVRFAGLEEVRTELEARHKAGRPVLLNFWATWCVPCIEELPGLGDLAREWGDEGPAIIGVSLDPWVFPEEQEAEAKVRALLARTRVAYTNLIYKGEQDPLLNAFDLPGPIPYSILYGRDGRVIVTYVGPVILEDVRRAAADLAQVRGAARVSARRPTPRGRRRGDW